MVRREQIRLAAMAGVLGTVAIGGCGKPGGGAAAAPAGPPGTPVTAAAAVAIVEPVYIDEIGHTTPVETVTIVPQVSGKITARHFTDGEQVHKGQLLFEIDPRPFQAVLDQAKGQLGKDQATLSSSKWNVDHDTLAMQNHSISEQQLHNDTANRDQTLAAMAADNAQVAQAQLNLDYCQIKSPIDGLAGERLVDVGNVVNGGGQMAGTNLLVINKIDPIYADFTVTEAELAKVQDYMGHGTLSVQVKTPADAQVDAMAEAPPATQPMAVAPGTDQPADKTMAMENSLPKGMPSPATRPMAAPTTGPMAAPTTGPMAAPMMAPTTGPAVFHPRVGKLVFLDNAVQDASGTVRLRAEVPNADHHFWPGQYVNVRLVLTTKRSVMVPVVAEQVSQQGLFVYKVTPNAASPTGEDRRPAVGHGRPAARRPDRDRRRPRRRRPGGDDRADAAAAGRADHDRAQRPAADGRPADRPQGRAGVVEVARQPGPAQERPAGVGRRA